MLNEQQKKVAFNIEGNTIVSASPGTGKTRTLIARAQHKLDSLPRNQNLALITYTNAAADEISSRLVSDEKRVFIGTIHRFCLEFILRPFGWIYDWKKPRIITYGELKEFIELNEDVDLGNNPIDELNRIKRQLNGELDQSVDWSNSPGLDYVSDLYFGFLDYKGAVDFNEILFRSYKIISENDFVVSSLSNRFYEISIDEFQDTNIFQYKILSAINSKSNCTFFIVGDEKQKIYRFAGAIDDAFDQAATDFKANVEELSITYRSTTNIVNAYSSLFDDHPNLRNESKYKEKDLRLQFFETTKKDNNIKISSLIKSIHGKSNVPLSEIAILTTSWRDAFSISKGLRQEYHVVGLGALPHKSLNSSTFRLIRSISRFTYSTKMRNLRIVRRNIEFHALENNLFDDDQQLVFWTNSIVAKIGNLDLSVQLIDGLNQLRDLFNLTFNFYHSDFDEIIGHISDEEANAWSLEKYFKTLSGIDGITVNTIHQSKGMEYGVVILNGINENKIPYQKVLERRGNDWLYEPLTEESLENGKKLTICWD